MTAKIVSVIGATGVQGGSIVNALIKDSNYSVRAITRNPQSSAAKAFTARGVEVVKADVNDLSSLVSAFKGSYAIYAVTDFFEPFGKHGAEKATEIESQQGINLAKAAIATTGLQHYIWSTLPNAGKITGGKYVVPHFAAKNLVDDYIRSQPELLEKTTFLWNTYYAQNFQFPMFTPIHVPTAGKYIQVGVTSPDVAIKTVGDARVNIGIFAKAALDQPQKTRGGRFVLAAVEDTTVDDILQVWAQTHEATAQYIQITEEAYYALWPSWAEEMGLMMQFWEEYGGEKSWSSDEEILTQKELGVTGLAGLKQSLAAL
jgi:NmrA-like family